MINADSEAILVPVPGSNASYHTTYFAAAIQELTGYKVVPALCKSSDQKSQKSQNKQGRRDAIFKMNEEFTAEIYQASTIYLIDDVVTTGLTLKSISKTLRLALPPNQKENLKISALTLFFRSTAADLKI